MKKNLCLALLLALALLALTACGQKDTANPAPVQPATEAPTEAPTEEPTPEPTEEPTAEPTEEPTPEPTAKPTAEPTAEPTEEPAEEPAEEPVAEIIGGADGETEIAVADEEPAETDAVLATAYDGAVSVTKSSIQEEYDATLDAYVNMYAQYGYAMDEYDIDFQMSVAQETVQYRINQLIVEHKVLAEGYELTEEKEAEFLAQAQETYDSLRSYYESYLSAYGYTGDDLAAIVDEEVAASGYTVDSLLENIRLNDMLGYLYDLATAGVTVSEDEVREAFEVKLAEAQALYEEDVDAYIDDYLMEADILYTPEGLRLVHCIYIALSDEDVAELAAVGSIVADATPSEATLSEAEIAELSGSEKANAVLARIRDGLDFTEAMITFNEDGSTPEQLDAGYPVCADSVLYSPAFVEGAMALENVGDVSDVIVTETGCFILRYVSDIEAGSVSLEDRIEIETEEALEAKMNEAYSDYVDALLSEANIVINDLSPLLHIFVSESVEATVAYASVSEETALTDVPGGDTVATLSAGATLDVLGHIGIDGEAYVFVAVPGTDIKGFVDASGLTEMAEADALAVDNAALVAANDELAVKLPVFTIVMNDGSIIYGELYPDVAPESVGNFIELAGSGFYDGLTFHRVIAGFMIQGGDPNGNGTGGPGYAIRGEFASNGVTNDLSHTRGVLSMARSSAPDSAGSQFFIMHADNDYLDGDYTAFGLVLGGIETVDLIASTPTDGNDRPMIEQTMRTVYVETFGQTYPFTQLDD